MQFGIFTVGDVTMDPTTGYTPTEHERIKNTVAIAINTMMKSPMGPASPPDRVSPKLFSASRCSALIGQW